MRSLLFLLIFSFAFCAPVFAGDSHWLEYIESAKQGFIENDYQIESGQTSIVLNRPRAKVFEVLTDISSLSRFLPPLTYFNASHVQQSDDGEYYVEAYAIVERAYAYLIKKETLYSVIQYSPQNHSLTLKFINGSSAYLEIFITVDQHEQGSLVEVITTSISADDASSYSMPMLNLHSIKRYLEEGIDIFSLGCDHSHAYCF